MVLLIAVFFMALTFIFILCYYFTAGRLDLSKASFEFDIFGLADGFVPQGICYSEKLDAFLISGYMSDKKPSRVYCVDANNRSSSKFVTFKRTDNVSYFGHAGGISACGNFGYISSEGKVFAFSLFDLKNTASGGVVKFAFEQKTQNGADFCFCTKNMIYVGEFFKMSKFKTDLAHHIFVDDKVQNHSIVFGFEIGFGGKLKTVPSIAISVPDKVQGIVILKDKIFLSVSYALEKSKILVFENSLFRQTGRSIAYDENNVPLHFLNQNLAKKVYTLPPMLEEIEYHDGRLLALFESASKKYRWFNRVRVKRVFGIKVD